MKNEEHIQRNCEQIQEILKQHPNRKIAVLRLELDKCQIREKGTKRVLYEGDTEATLHRVKEILEPITTVEK